MGSRIADAPEYAHLWAGDEVRAVFEDTGRRQAWLDILAALAAAQADLGIVPAPAAEAIRHHARATDLDIDLLVRETRRTGHSTLGLIHTFQRLLPEPAREWVYYGATVQDVTDTWTGLAAKRVLGVVERDLEAVEESLLELAERHRDTVMVGRTHGQPGSPITFGFKVASWADEIRRHLERLGEGRGRWVVGQLAGAVGTLAFFGGRGLELRERFCGHLELGTPTISWLTARDRVAELANVLAMVSATLGRIGSEIYTLQRPEIGELREAGDPATVGSITMPHKRNPEVSEHLVTLGRLTRVQASALLEAMVGEHERDGRSWKAEWPAFPETCLLTSASVGLAREVIDGLEVDADAMAANLRAAGYSASERVLAALAPRIGKHRAQAALQDALRSGRERGEALAEVLARAGALDAAADLDLDAPDVGLAGAMVDAVVEHARAAGAGRRSP